MIIKSYLIIYLISIAAHVLSNMFFTVPDIDDILTCTKTATPYGLRLGWKLPGPCGMTFTIHMKDPKKV